MSEDLYQTLGINKNATEAEIKKSYKKLAMKHHPDKGGDEEHFKKISHAYSILSDKQKKQQYDTFGTYDDNHMDMSSMNEMFQSFFGGGRNPFESMFFGQSQQRPQEKPVPNKEITLNVTLEEVFQGKKISYRIQRKCWSSGDKCKSCEGKGMVMQMAQIAPGFMTQNVSPCSICKGNGTIYDEKYAHVNNVIVPITIPKGIRNGGKLAVRKEGDVYGTKKGDIIVVIKYKKNALFQISETNPLDVIMKLDVSFSEFMHGFSRGFTFLDEKKYMIKTNSPLFPIIDKNPEKIIRNMGFEYKGMKGNFILHFSIHLPNPDKIPAPPETVLNETEFKLLSI